MSSPSPLVLLSRACVFVAAAVPCPADAAAPKPGGAAQSRELCVLLVGRGAVHRGAADSTPTLGHIVRVSDYQPYRVHVEGPRPLRGGWLTVRHSPQVELWTDNGKPVYAGAPIALSGDGATFNLRALAPSAPGEAYVEAVFDVDADGEADAVGLTTFTVVQTQLQEFQFGDADLEPGNPVGNPTYPPMNRQYHHLDPITPIVRFYDDQTTLETVTIDEVEYDVVNVAGRVFSPTDLMGGDEHPVLLMVNGDIVLPDSDGFFTHRVIRSDTSTEVAASAYNVLGGWASDRMDVVDEQVYPDAGQAFNPSFQRLVFGDEAAAGWLLNYPSITLELVTPDGQAIQQISVSPQVENGFVVTEPFVISEVDPYFSVPEQFSLMGRVLRTPMPPEDPTADRALEHDLRVGVPGIELGRIRFAGYRMTDPPNYSLVEVQLDPNDIATREVALNVRNVDVENVECELVSDLAADFPQWFGDFGPLRGQDNNVLREIRAQGIEVLQGPHEFKMHAGDAADDALRPRIYDSFNNDLSKYPSYTSIQAFLRLNFGRGPQLINFRLLPDIPVQTIKAECARMKLIIVGVVLDGTDSCGNSAVSALLVRPADGNIPRATARIYSSPIHESFEESESANQAVEVQPQNWPPSTDLIETKLLGNRRYDKARVNAIAEMNNRRTRLTQNEIMGPGMPANKFYVVDMRADYTYAGNIDRTGFDPGGVSTIPLNGLRNIVRANKALITGALSKTESLQSIAVTPPLYLHRTNAGNPTYRLFEYSFVGMDQRAAGALRPFNGPIAENAKLNGAAPRIQLQRAAFAKGRTGLENAGIIQPHTRGVLLVVHGYRNDSDAPDIMTSTAHDMPRGYWPYVQFLYEQHGFLYADTSNDDPVVTQDYPVLHVLWTGDWRPLIRQLDTSPCWFNWDDALARDCGERVLATLIADIVTIKDGMEQGADQNNDVIDDPDWRGIMIHAESLGNRTVASALRALQARFPLTRRAGGNAANRTYPRIRWLMAHPALRRYNIDRAHASVTGIPPNNCTGGRNCVPDTNLQQELRGLQEYNQSVLLFYSPFDKAGIVFKIMQDMEMLGRCGLPPGYNVNTAWVKLHQYWVNADNEFRDLWHVDCFGWYVPGMYIVSRPTYTYNGGWNSSVGVLESVKWVNLGPIIEMRGAHITPIWSSAQSYFHNNVLPKKVSALR
ncbi:MAG: hypothetical protein HRF50_16980 [Phycisphaerae bacterium]